MQESVIGRLLLSLVILATAWLLTFLYPTATLGGEGPVQTISGR